MSKELWLAENERLKEAAREDLGRELTDAEETAIDDGTYDSLRERLFDMADIERKRAKGE